MAKTIDIIFLGHPMASQVLGIAWADSVESECCDGGPWLELEMI